LRMPRLSMRVVNKTKILRNFWDNFVVDYDI